MVGNVIHETERKENMVSRQAIRLGLGHSMRLAGLGGVNRLAAFALGRDVSRARAPGFFHHIYPGSFGGPDRHLLPQGRETKVALGEGLVVSNKVDR